jgi:hypothetical protein
MAQLALPVQPAVRAASFKAAGLGHTTWFLIILYALAVIWGIRSVYFWKLSLLDVLVPMALVLCLGWWTIEDARRRGHPIPLLSQQWFILIAGWLAPGYVVWSRGWCGVGWLILNVFGWQLVATVMMHAAGTILFGVEWPLIMDW